MPEKLERSRSQTGQKKTPVLSETGAGVISRGTTLLISGGSGDRRLTPMLETPLIAHAP